LSHDFDQVLGINNSAAVNASLFACVHLLARRQCDGPQPLHDNAYFVPVYYAQLNNLLDTAFQPASQPHPRPVPGRLGSGATVTTMKTYATNRYNWCARRFARLDGEPQPVDPEHVSVFLERDDRPGGASHASQTRSVLVNGTPANWIGWQARWTNTSVVLQPASTSSWSRPWTRKAANLSAGASRSGMTTLDDHRRGRHPHRHYLVARGQRAVSRHGNLTLPASDADHSSRHHGVPGFWVNLTVNSAGRLVAEGSDTQRIRFSRVPGTASSWGGIVVNGGAGTPETRITYADFEFNGTTAIHSVGGTLFLDISRLETRPCSTSRSTIPPSS